MGQKTHLYLLPPGKLAATISSKFIPRQAALQFLQIIAEEVTASEIGKTSRYVRTCHLLSTGISILEQMLNDPLLEEREVVMKLLAHYKGMT
jgi:hypothetical protein